VGFVYVGLDLEFLNLDDVVGWIVIELRDFGLVGFKLVVSYAGFAVIGTVEGEEEVMIGVGVEEGLNDPIIKTSSYSPKNSSEISTPPSASQWI